MGSDSIHMCISNKLYGYCDWNPRNVFMSLLHKWNIILYYEFILSFHKMETISGLFRFKLPYDGCLFIIILLVFKLNRIVILI